MCAKKFIFLFASLLFNLKVTLVQAAPNIDISIDFKNRGQALSHELEFLVHEDQIWCRSRGSRIPWQAIPNPIPHPGWQWIKADGMNLMGIEKNNSVYYKKVGAEFRDRAGIYHFENHATKNNWTSSWFSLPLACHFPGLRGLLELPEGTQSWAMSHRGIHSRYFESNSGKKQFAGKFLNNVTSAYVLSPDGRSIYLADPFLPRQFRGRRGFRKLDLPERFLGQILDASASMMLVLGNMDSTQTLIYALADFDTLGNNPFLAGFWDHGSRLDLRWRSVSLPTRSTLISNEITILQTGEGNRAREIRLEGSDAEGHHGYYALRLAAVDPEASPASTQDLWQFTATAR